MKLHLLLAFAALLLLAGCKAGGETTNQNQVELADGVQQVTLSWGKFNYNPEVITVKSGMPVRITADMQRITGCFRAFEIPALRISKYLTERDNTVEFTPTKPGKYVFTCSMGMGKGTLIVE